MSEAMFRMTDEVVGKIANNCGWTDIIIEAISTIKALNFRILCNNE
jgi:hypothetical protein